MKPAPKHALLSLQHQMGAFGEALLIPLVLPWATSVHGHLKSLGSLWLPVRHSELYFEEDFLV